MKVELIIFGNCYRVKGSQPEIVGQARTVSKKGNVALLVNGFIRWYKPEELEPEHG